MRRFYILLPFFLLLHISTTINVCAQGTYNLKGTIRDNSGPIFGASVQVVEINKNTITDSEGRFEITNVAKGTYTLLLQHMGYKQLKTTVTASGQTKEAVFILEEDHTQLSEVQVNGRTETQQAKLQPIKVEVINTKAIQEQPSTLVELMNRSAGIRIRQTGGLGSNAGLMMNGFQDRAIKNFKDGIPMDYLGAGYNISLVPVNMLERVEVYKGVLPTGLGADALGGAVNMVTKKSLYRYAEASYEFASFNTHRASVNALYSDTTRHFFIGTDAFVNRSDNDYKVDVIVTDQETAARSPATVRLFHNKFANYYAEAYGGLTNLKWVDELRLGITWFHINRQNQYGSTMSQPFGASVSRQYSVIPTLRYRKQFGKLGIDQFLTTSNIHTAQVDTLRGTYDWYGHFIPSPSRRGEISMRGSLSDITFSYFTSRTHLGYQIGERHLAEINVVSTNIGRKGSDPLGLTLPETGQDILSLPAKYYKIIGAAGIQSVFLNDKLINNLIAKFFHYNTSTINVDIYGTALGQHRTTSENSFGIAEALKFALTANTFFRVSAEAATRLPEQDEMFGDGNFHRSNFLLKPEKSTNVNLGFRTERSGAYALEVNSFYRITRDLILKVPIDFLYTQNQNVENVKGLGFETDLSVTLNRWLRANGNFTYQDFRIFDTGNRLKEKARLRNTPYFFANLALNSTWNNIGGRGKLNLYYYYTFVREYYLDYVPQSLEPDGFLGLWGKAKFDAPNIIPNQGLHAAGFTYNPAGERFSIGFQAKNILNAHVYDNFRIQNAGRSLHLKLNYTLK
ncbi:TonB-dependent receptor [Dyadobacter fanqingshengii]|uniref:Carboxypeptidase-like regulatory domain-containing protein n=1 Tax=Dyadobacter fanqingshengii TaxID=2906443 RepID=A0A9X1PA86_9BACT|nr:TonB-dependent receptor [Dyadobacter fanqingshengii]MCF0041231.1 carboxypeptidase-like regulatory domain-containing protein [Dyadobacter fanqingshengii]USJ37044.1 carboxypeptidase-like regulatory domain-containing protein [Dyadobacter fanqingshengii]